MPFPFMCGGDALIIGLFKFAFSLFAYRLIFCCLLLCQTGQVEDAGAHGKNLPTAKARGASATRASGQGAWSSCLLVPAAGEAASQPTR